MEKNQEQVMVTLNEKEQKSVTGGLFPPNIDEKKSLMEQLLDEIRGGWICY